MVLFTYFSSRPKCVEFICKAFLTLMESYSVYIFLILITYFLNIYRFDYKLTWYKNMDRKISSITFKNFDEM